ncbi:hypothetical protein LB467_16210 [Salegentibacter sp. JZCK2]|uniref:hypothetical protein n=1 Tax=Salegentibacter tibetensis TaxID=2873600 RepID=UPI001CCF636C|nr:hypothetical protein [Salegentibacter tibetensis]MBZ9731237.1 hypothetical protein [Salegentibacter tibetensis]
MVDSEVNSIESREVWSREKTNKWYSEQPGLVGANFNVGTAINQLETRFSIGML